MIQDIATKSRYITDVGASYRFRRMARLKQMANGTKIDMAGSLGVVWCDADLSPRGTTEYGWRRPIFISADVLSTIMWETVEYIEKLEKLLFARQRDYKAECTYQEHSR